MSATQIDRQTADDVGVAQPRRFRWNAFDWLVAPLLLLLVGLFFWRILTPNLADRASFPPGDFSHQFWAFATFEARQLAAGHLPLWNPFTYSGTPFWADIQSAVFYPISLLTVVLSGGRLPLFNLELEAILHFWLAGLFTYLFARRLIRYRPAAFLSAITFTFGGYLTSYPSQQLAVLETDVWLPLMLLLLDLSLMDRSGACPRRRRRPRWELTLPAGLVWGIAVLAGHPQSAMLVLYTFSVYVAFLALAYPPQAETTQTGGRIGLYLRRLRQPFLHWLATIVVGLGLSAVAWLPGLEYMRLSVRAAGFYDKMSGGFPLYDWLQMLLPGSVSLYSPLYVGLLSLVLAIWIALTLRRREVGFWAGLAVVAFLLSFGGETFLYTPFYLVVPGFSIFRDQERLAFVFSLCLSILAGYGLGYFLDYAGPVADKSRVILRKALGWLLVGGVWTVLLFFYGLNSNGWQESSPFYGLLSRSVWLTILIALIWGLLHLAGHWRPEGTKTDSRVAGYALVSGFLIIATLDLFTVNWKTNVYPGLPETQTQTPAAVSAILDDADPSQDFRVYNEYRLYENYGVAYGLEDTWGASPLRLVTYDETYHTLRMERLWELLNVQYVITWRQELYAPSTIIYQEAGDKDTTYVHRLIDVAPRAWLVYGTQQAAETEMLPLLDATDFDPAAQALVPPGSRLDVSQPAGTGSANVAITQRSAGAMRLAVNSPANGLLVLSEIYYPGWQAQVDGLPAEIFPTDYILRGIPVSAGEHVVTLVFQPVTFWVGAVISGLILVVSLLAAGWIWLRRKKDEARDR